MTIREAIANSGIDTLDAYIILGNLLTQRRRCAAEITKTILLAMSDEHITEEEQGIFNKLVKRRKNGECVAYITGKKEFWGLEFFISPAVLVPRPETEILVETALKIVRELHELARIKKEEISILDLCTGSGAIAIALKHELPKLEVYATDISQEALEAAKTNAVKLLSDNKNITFLQGDLYKAFLPPTSYLLPPTFSLIVSNPPYIKTSYIKTLQPEVQNEPHIALDGGKTGLEIIERIINDAPEYLKHGGHLLMEADPRQMNEIESMLATGGFSNIIKYKDLAGLDRVIGGVFEKEK